MSSGSTSVTASSKGKKQVQALVAKYKDNLDTHRSPAYNETQVRREFVDPFFRALGWDVENETGMSGAYKDVVHEDKIRVGESRKAPDYSFRIGGRRSFFVETKKPSVSLRDATEPAFQLRRYAWSAGLPISVLTDFEEFAVYDCRFEPQLSDSAVAHRVIYRGYEKYIDEWDEIWELFSKEWVQDGSLEQFADQSLPDRGVTTVDEAFLADIEHWREVLAVNIAVRNKSLSSSELNFALQQTIDRIIFLRICEDRGIEPYGQIQSVLQEKDIYPKLLKLFTRADERYNSGLFHFKPERERPSEPDRLSLQLSIDDNALSSIIWRLYYPSSPYEFSVLPPEILGQVYEQFLGKVVRLVPGHRAVVEEKPEVRKAGGVYYTPRFIVDDIVQKTIGRQVEGNTPQQVSRLKFLDPACGSGSFLLGVYDFLLEWYRRAYVEDDPAKHARGRPPRLYQGPEGEWRLTTTERKRILVDNVFGVDIDAQAVEVTKLSLLLRVLENESSESLATQLELFHERALPDLDGNIKNGNSLVGTELFQLDPLSIDEEDRLKPFDWEIEFSDVMAKGGFDAVIGNPPYDVMEKQRGAASWPHAVLSEYVRHTAAYAGALGGKLNLFRFFVVRSLELLRTGGSFGMILPLSLMADISTAASRRHLIGWSDELVVDAFPQKDNPKRRIFAQAKLSTGVVSSVKSEKSHDTGKEFIVRVFPGNSFDDQSKRVSIRVADLLLLDPKNAPVPMTDQPNWDLCTRIHRLETVKRLADVGDFDIRRGEINQTIYRKFITSDSSHARLLKGVEIGRFRIHEKLSQGKKEWLNEKAFLAENTSRDVVAQRRIATQRITGVDELNRVVATLVEPPMYFADSTNSISLISDQADHSLEYLLALLNSKLCQWRFGLTSTNNNVGTNELDCLPFRVINWDEPADRKRYEEVEHLSRRLMSLYQRASSARDPSTRDSILRQASEADDQVDRLVYELFELSPEDVDLVESEWKAAVLRRADKERSSVG